MAQLGKAYIEVRADLSKFPAQLRADLEKALREGIAGVSFEDFGKKAAKAGEDGAEELGKGFSRRSKSRSRKAGEDAGRDVGLGFFALIRKLFSEGSSSGGFFGGIGNIFKGLSKEAEDSVEQIQGVFKNLSSAGSQVSSVFSGIGGGLQALVYVAAVPAIIGLIGFLVQLSGALLALPAAIAVAVAAFGPLLTALHGVTDAIGAGFSGDAKKYQQALKGLAPSAREVVREIVGLKDAFNGIKSATQEAFFAPLVGQFSALKTTLLPALRDGFIQAGGALGRFASEFLKVLSEPKVVADIAAVFQTLGNVLDRIGPVAAKLFESMFGLVRTGLPFVQALTDKLASAGQQFAGFLDKANGSGKISDLIQKSIGPLKELGQLIGITAKLFGTIFANPDIQKGGNDMVKSLIGAIAMLQKFFASANGQKVLKDLGDSMRQVGIAILGAAKVIIILLEGLHYLAAGLEAATKWTVGFVKTTYQAFVVGLSAIGRFFSQVGGAIADFFTQTIPHAASAVGKFFASIGSSIGSFFTQTVPGWFHSIVAYFEGLPGQAQAGLGSLRDKLVSALESAFTGAVDAVARNVGRIIGLILAAPDLIKTNLQGFVRLIGDAFTAAFDYGRLVVSNGIHSVVSFFTVDLPNGIRAAFDWVTTNVKLYWDGVVASFHEAVSGVENAMSSAYHAITSFFSRAFAEAKASVREGINAIGEFFNALPGKIASYGGKLYDAAVGLGRSIGNGLRNIGSFASDIGRDIVNAVKSGVNHVIDSINAGIGDIDAVIPGSLPRIPHLARGGIVDSPTLAMIGEGGRREVVIPLTNPDRANQLARESGLTQILARGASAPVVNVYATLGTGEIITVLDTRVEQAFASQGQELAYGART